MANPGPYPMGPPMGGPMQPMGGGMGMMRPPVRQGTSKVVPVVVAAGLAVGVFCGLRFGLGTGKRNASADTQKASNGVKAQADEPYTPESLANPNVKIPDKNAPKTGSNAQAANTGSAQPAGGSNAVPAEPAIKPTKLVVEIKPEAAAQTAKVFVDGQPITGLATEIALEPGTPKKTVKVLVKATSYKDIEQDVDVEGESVTVKLELTKGRNAPTSNATAATGTGGTGDTTGGG